MNRKKESPPETDAARAMVKEFAERRARLRDEAGQQLNAAVKNAFSVWEKDPMNPAFQRSILAQLPYMVDPDAPILNGSISIWDVFDGRVNCPHRDYYNPESGQCIDGDVHQGHHFLQSAEEGMKNDWSEEVIVASFLHDFGKLIKRQNHSWFSAEMFKPYISEKLYWMILWHFDIVDIMPTDDARTKSSGLVHPSRSVKDMWYNQQAFRDSGGRAQQRLALDMEPILNHRWYPDLAKVRQCDDFGRVPLRNPDIRAELEPMVSRHVKFLPGGLGNDGSSAERLWQTVIEGVWMT
tara:strand:+ start:90169 stop:91053 length:885 start_codon:yes stop_codon:yes gene_type:complete